MSIPCTSKINSSIICIFFFIIHVRPISAITKDNLVTQIKTRESKITSFSSEVTKIIEEKGRDSRRVRYTFDYMHGHFFKLHYTDTKGERFIIGTPNEITEYLPFARRALRTSLRNFDGTNKKKKYFKAIELVSIPFLFIADDLARVTFNDIFITNETYVLRFDGMYKEKRARFIVWIDSKTLIVSKVLINSMNDTNELFLSYKATEAIYHGGNIWFPKCIEFTTYYMNKKVYTKITIEHFSLPKDFPKSYFDYEIPQFVQIEYNNSSATESKTKSTETKETSLGAAFLSGLTGPGTGEWLINDTQDFAQCCIEHLIVLIPIIGIFNWIGSVIDAYHKEPAARSNWLFTTMEL